VDKLLRKREPIAFSYSHKVMHKSFAQPQARTLFEYESQAPPMSVFFAEIIFVSCTKKNLLSAPSKHLDLAPQQPKFTVIVVPRRPSTKRLSHQLQR
jgi:hypothetical protein